MTVNAPGSAAALTLCAISSLVGPGARPSIPARGPADAFAVRGARVFDGARVWDRATVVVEEGRVVALGPDVQPPPGAEVVDGTGRTLIPGLFDAHVHTFSRDQLEAALAFGVTTELDMFTVPATVEGLRREQEAGEATDRADIFSAGILATAPGGHGTEYGFEIPTVAGPEEAAEFVEARLADGSDWIKIILDDGSAYGIDFPTLDAATVGALAEAAHARGAIAVVHVGRLRGARVAVGAGADGLAHVWVDSLPSRAFVKAVADRSTFVIPTLTVLQGVTGEAAGASLLEDPRIAPLLGPAARTSLGSWFPFREREASFEVALGSVRALHEAGVPILAGTDAGNPGTTYGASVHRELELLVEAGLSPVEALRAATSAPAAAFGLDDRGRIAPGRRADLVLVAGDPTREITATRAIERVWKEGVPFDLEAFRARTADAVAAAERGPEAPAALAEGRMLVTDFDDGGLETAFGGSWISTTDAMMGGGSTAELAVADGGAAGTTRALQVRGEVAEGLPYAWAGGMFMPGSPPMSPVDLSAARGIAFHARGDGATYRVLLFHRRGGQIPAALTFTAGPEWEEHEFAWSDFDGDGSDVMGVAIVGGPAPGPFELWIDQVELR